MNMDRRTFLTIAGAAAARPAGFVRTAAAQSQEPAPVRRLLQMNGYALNAETPLDLLTTYLTPTDLFFIRHHWNPLTIDSRAWTLDVGGDVGRPLRLTLDDLKQMPQVSATCVLQCAGNGRGLFEPRIPGLQWKYGAVGNARWTGVRVGDLLDRAEVKSSSRHLHAFGADVPPARVPPFHRSLEIEKAMADAIVAFEMNGQPLPAAHGAPARLVVPGWAGDHWMKWLVRLDAAATAQTGFYMDTAYRYPVSPGAPGVALTPQEMRPVTELFVKSSITTAPARARVGTEVVLRGFAFSGAPDIAQVDVTDDDGRTWRPAELSPEHDPYAWRLWTFRWTPKVTGPAVLMTRATDSRGAVQPRQAVWNQSGYLHNGWHAATIGVDA